MIGHTIDGVQQDYTKLAQWASQADDITLKSVMQQAGGKLGNMKVGDFRKFIIGADPATQAKIAGGLEKFIGKIPGVSGKTATRMAGSGLAKGLGRFAPGVSVAFNVMDVADIVTGDESFANKAMDATAMTIGGVLGSAGGPLGASMGASTGKFISDGTQWLFGDKKTPEQRRMEEALAALQIGGV